MDLVILIGLQASGKSTFRRQRFDGTHVVVSKDSFRNNKRPARRQAFLVGEALSIGRSVVVDNTNVRREDRLLLIRQAEEFHATVFGYYLQCSLENSLRRNALRTGVERVPDVGVISMAKLFELPTWSEGYHELYLVSSESPDGFEIATMQR